MIIGFLGKSGSGKDTCCDYLVRNYGYTKMTFAKPLKDAVGILFDLSHDQLYSKKEVIDKRWNKSPRELLQYFGTDVIRNNFDHTVLRVVLKFLSSIRIFLSAVRTVETAKCSEVRS